MGGRRRQVSVRLAAWERASKIRDDIAANAGRACSIAEVIERGLQCLDDANSRGAWLSPAEAGSIYERRCRDSIASIIAQLSAALSPGRQLVSIVFEPEQQRIRVSWSEGPPLAFYSEGLTTAGGATADA